MSTRLSQKATIPLRLCRDVCHDGMPEALRFPGALLLPSREGDATEPGNHRNVESEVVPPAGVVWFVDSDAVFEQTDNERDRSDPSMPDACEEACRLLRRICGTAGKTTGQSDGQQYHAAERSVRSHHMHISGWQRDTMVCDGEIPW